MWPRCVHLGQQSVSPERKRHVQFRSKLFFVGALWLPFAMLGCGGCTSNNGTGDEGKKVFAKIGTGSSQGVYYPTGLHIKELVEDSDSGPDVSLTVAESGGSEANINGILGENYDFGIVSADVLHQAQAGEGAWEGKPQKDLRAAFSLHTEAVTLVATEESGIKTVADLKGKRVNLGNAGSGTYTGALAVLEMAGLSLEDVKAERVKAGDAPQLMKDGKLDAFFYVAGHPNAAFEQATVQSKPVRFISIEPTADLLKEHPYYSATTILMSRYPKATNEEEEITTFGVKAILVTRTGVPEAVVEKVTREVFENLDKFKGLHDSRSQLTKKGMSSKVSVPFHDGASKYFQEAELD